SGFGTRTLARAAFGRLFRFSVCLPPSLVKSGANAREAREGDLLVPPGHPPEATFRRLRPPSFGRRWLLALPASSFPSPVNTNPPDRCRSTIASRGVAATRAAAAAMPPAHDAVRDAARIPAATARDDVRRAMASARQKAR